MSSTTNDKRSLQDIIQSIWENELRTILEKIRDQSALIHAEYRDVLSRDDFSDVIAIHEDASYLLKSYQEIISDPSRNNYEIIHSKSGTIGLGGYAQALLAGDLTDAELKQIVESLAVLGEKVYILLHDLLDWAKIEQGHIDLKPQPLNLVEYLRPLEQKYPVVLKVEIDDNISHIYGDKVRVSQILFMLFNVIQNWTASGKVILGCHQPSVDYILNEFIGFGRGILEDKHSSVEKIAAIFQRGYLITTDKITSETLHLIIAHQLIKLHGGDCGVRGTVGESMTFWFTLPIQPLGSVTED